MQFKNQSFVWIKDAQSY